VAGLEMCAETAGLLIALDNVFRRKEVELGEDGAIKLFFLSPHERLREGDVGPLGPSARAPS